MLDLNDFIAERGGDVKKIKESQRKRFAPEEAVDDVIALYEEARKGMLMPRSNASYANSHPARYEVTQIGSKLNVLMKEIGQKKKVPQC